MDPDRTREEDALDETLEETFPASDAPANTVVTGILIRTVGDTHHQVRDNSEARRFELVRDGQLAFLNYERRRDALVLVHTEVPASLRGRHIGDILIKAALDAAKADGLRIVALCPFVKAYLRKHPEAG